MAAEGFAVGTTTADGAGAFTADLELDRVRPGTLTVTAACGVFLVGHIDVALTTSPSNGGQVAIIIVFFILFAATMIRLA